MAENLRVVVLQQGDIYVAQCLEYDVCAQGKTEEEAMKGLRAVLIAERDLAREEGRDMDAIGAAPEAFHEIWRRNEMTRKELSGMAA